MDRVGRIGYGEMALPTVCVGEGMVWRGLRPEHVGEPYDPQGCLDRRGWEGRAREVEG